ncbi:putative polyketide synthase protein [Hypoxylon cercidicola]|nr:putative polyketide synthase protein [Hypoxylon cercidicola]
MSNLAEIPMQVESDTSTAMMEEIPQALETKVKVALTGTPETTLVPLIAKSLDAKHPKPLLQDVWAKSVLQKLDHDTSKYLIGDQERVTYSQRARYFDNWTAEFLAEHPRATVLHVACGLDSRCLRLKWASSGVRWIDIDLPDVVALRRQLLPNPKGDYSLVGADVTEDKWLEQIPADRSTVIVFEGLSMYLDEAVGHRLIQRLVGHFKTGQLLFDAIGSVVVYLQKMENPIMATGAKFVWGLDNPVELESLDSRLQLRDRLRPIEREGFSDYPHCLSTDSFRILMEMPTTENIPTTLS